MTLKIWGSQKTRPGWMALKPWVWPGKVEECLFIMQEATVNGTYSEHIFA